MTESDKINENEEMNEVKTDNAVEPGNATELAEDVLDAAEEAVEPDGFEGANLVTLFDEDGNEFEFELIDYVDYEEKLYAVLMPSEIYEDGSDEVVIMEMYFEGDEPNFVFVEDEALAQKVLDTYIAGRPDGE